MILNPSLALAALLSSPRLRLRLPFLSPLSARPLPSPSPFLPLQPAPALRPRPHPPTPRPAPRSQASLLFPLPQFVPRSPRTSFPLTFLFYYFYNGRGAETIFFHRPGPPAKRFVYPIASSLSGSSLILPPPIYAAVQEKPVCDVASARWYVPLFLPLPFSIHDRSSFPSSPAM